MTGQAELDAVRRAVVLSRSALGATSPNPPVGAVVLDRAGTVVYTGQGGDQNLDAAIRKAM
jgi:pyrimidine deaminase RibD-like protein